MARCYHGHNSSNPKILSYIVRSLKYADARCLLSDTSSPVELYTPTPMLPYSEKFQCVSQILPWPGSWSHFHSRRCLHSAFESAADCNDVEKVDLCDALTLPRMLWKAVLSARAAAVQKWMSDNLLCPCLPWLLLWNWSICREAMFTFWQYVPGAERGGVLIYAWHKHFAGIWWPRACHTRASLHVLPQVKVPVQWLSVHRTCMQGSEKWKVDHTLYCQCAAHNLPFKITLWCNMVTSWLR